MQTSLVYPTVLIEDTHRTTSVRSWVRRRRQDKVQDVISEAFRDRVLRPGTDLSPQHWLLW